MFNNVVLLVFDSYNLMVKYCADNAEILVQLKVGVFLFSKRENRQIGDR